MTDESDERQKGSKAGCLLAVLIALPFFYILSPIPIFLLMMQMPESVSEPMNDLFTILYAPIQWAYDNSDLVRAFYNWQEELVGIR